LKHFERLPRKFNIISDNQTKLNKIKHDYKQF
jgi:hypothetical protein